ncbi:extensin family protein [Pararhizobium haloflavum]|uniref:extensin family protein n=1 Tax=Pararhizobium haloflavum TaxID=2037914 RepID=UPI000C1A565A|nr:extensin family protein [Pararhizobium haloflavum]
MAIGAHHHHRKAIRHLGRTVCRTALTTGVLAGFLVSCSVSSVLEPPSSVPTGSITPSYSAPAEPAPQSPSADPWARTADEGPLEALPPETYGAPQARVSQLPSYDSLASQPQTQVRGAPPASLGTLTIDSATGQPVAPGQASASIGDNYSSGGGLAAVAPMPAGGYGADITDQPAPMEIAPAPSVAALPPAAAAPAAPVSAPPSPPVAAAPQQVAPEPEPRRLAGLIPRALNPLASSRRETARSGLPAAEAACRDRLRRLGVTFTDKPAVGNGGSCGIGHPVEISALSGNVKVRPATTLNCPMAEAFATWVKNELAPGVRKRYLSGIDTVGSMGGYSCRTMNSRRGAPMSEHSKGNAIDVGSLKLNSGKTIKVRSKGFFAFRERGLLNSVRDDGCKYFTTILGPGSDANHADHFHFDLRARRNGYRHCD